MSEKPILVMAGASGLIGRYLMAAARDDYRIRVLTRRTGEDLPDFITSLSWNPRAVKENDEVSVKALSDFLEGTHAVVNLAGASIADGRLDEAHLRRVIESRVDSAQTLLAAHKRAKAPPAVWFQASASGYYGDCGDLERRESDPPGDTLLSDICKSWEAAPEDANGARLVTGRIGVVLAKDAPAWRKLILPIKLFVGGPFGSGEQWWPWIDAGDLARAILFLIACETCSGPYNLVAPEPVRQKQLVQAAARHLNRPARVSAPAFALRLALGRVADEVLLASQRALPERLQATDFSFDRSSLDAELRHLFG